MIDDMGKRHDVLIVDAIGGGLRVWADPGMKDVIESVSGVTQCTNPISSVEYSIILDPRYDPDWVKQEIIARVKIEG